MSKEAIDSPELPLRQVTERTENFDQSQVNSGMSSMRDSRQQDRKKIPIYQTYKIDDQTMTVGGDSPREKQTVIATGDSAGGPRLTQKGTLYINEKRMSSPLKNQDIKEKLQPQRDKDDSMLEVDENEENMVGIAQEILSPASKPDSEMTSSLATEYDVANKQQIKGVKLVMLTTEKSDEDLKHTQYQNSQPQFSPQKEANGQKIGQVQIKNNLTTQGSKRKHSQELAQEMSNEINDESGEYSNSFYDDVNEEELLQHLHGAGDVPLPLRKIDRGKNHQKRGPLKPVGAGRAPLIYRKGYDATGTERSQGGGKSLMIDTRQVSLKHKHANRSPFRYNQQYGRKVMSTKNAQLNRYTSNRNQTLSPTTTQLLSKMNGSSQGQVSLLAINKLPTVTRNSNGLDQHDLIKALFGKNSQTLNTSMHSINQQSSKFIGGNIGQSKRIISPEEQSMIDLLQQLANMQDYRGTIDEPALMLNEQSAANLPSDQQSLEREAALETQMAHKNSHIRIMGDKSTNPQPFLMQPQLTHQPTVSQQQAVEEDFQIKIKAQRKLNQERSRNNSKQTAPIINPDIFSIKSVETSTEQSLRNLEQMKHLANRLGRTIAQDEVDKMAGSSNKKMSAEIDVKQFQNFLQKRRASEDPTARQTFVEQQPFRSLNRKEQRLSVVPQSNGTTSMIHPQLTQQQYSRQNIDVPSSANSPHMATHTIIMTPQRDEERAQTGPAYGSHQRVLPDLRRVPGFSDSGGLDTTNRLQSFNLSSRQNNFPTAYDATTVGGLQDYSMSASIEIKKSKELANRNLARRQRYFQNLTDKQKTQIINMAHKAKYGTRKPKKGLAFRNEHQNFSSVPRQRNQQHDRSMHNMSPSSGRNNEIRRSQKEFVDIQSARRSYETLGEEEKLASPLLFQVTSPGTGVLQTDNLRENSEMTAYHHDTQSMPTVRSRPTTDYVSIQSPKFPDQSKMHLRPRYNPDDDEESVMVQRGQFSLRSQLKNQDAETALLPIRHRLVSQDASRFPPATGGPSSTMQDFPSKLADKPSRMTNLSKQAELSCDSPNRLIRQLGKQSPNYAHQNSNQNLYSREVYIKFPNKATQRRVLIKVQGEQSRRKQHPTIPHSGSKFANDSINEEATTEFIQATPAPVHTGGKSLNPFTTKKPSGAASAEQKPQDDTSPSGGDNHIVSSFTEQKVQPAQIDHQQHNLRARVPIHSPGTETASATNSSFFTSGQATNTAFPMAPKVNLIMMQTKLSDSGIKLKPQLEQVDEGVDNETPLRQNQEASSPKNSFDDAPKTKREFLEKYKQDMVITMKEQKRKDKETLEQRKVQEKRQSVAANKSRKSKSKSKSPDRSPDPADRSIDEQEMSLHGDSVLHINQQHYFDKSGGLQHHTKEKQSPKAIAMQYHRMKRFSGQMTEMDRNLYNQALKTFQNTTTIYNQGISARKGARGLATHRDSFENFGELNAWRQNSKEKLLETSQVLKIARMELAAHNGGDDVSSQGGSHADLEKYSRSIKSSNQVKQKIFQGPSQSTFAKAQMLQRPRFEDIEKMEQDENARRYQKELAKREFAKHKPSISKTSVDKIATERVASVKKFGGIAAEAAAADQPPHPQSNATTRSKQRKPSNIRVAREKSMNQTLQNNYQASYMPAHIAQNTSKPGKGPPQFVVEQNEDIMNLLEPQQ